MQLNSTEISELIKKRIAQFDVVSEARNTGTIVSVSDGIIRIHGLSDVMQGEMISLPGNRYAMALNLERDSVGAVVMGPYADLAEGMEVQCTGRILEVPVGRGLLGRVVNTLGQPIDGKVEIEDDGFSPVEVIAPGVVVPAAAIVIPVAVTVATPFWTTTIAPVPTAAHIDPSLDPEAVAGAVDDEGAFELSNTGKHRQHHASGWGGGIRPGFGQAAQACAFGLQLLGNVQ